MQSGKCKGTCTKDIGSTDIVSDKLYLTAGWCLGSVTGWLNWALRMSRKLPGRQRGMNLPGRESNICRDMGVVVRGEWQQVESSVTLLRRIARNKSGEEIGVPHWNDFVRGPKGIGEVVLYYLKEALYLFCLFRIGIAWREKKLMCPLCWDFVTDCPIPCEMLLLFYMWPLLFNEEPAQLGISQYLPSCQCSCFWVGLLV